MRYVGRVGRDEWPVVCLGTDTTARLSSNSFAHRRSQRNAVNMSDIDEDILDLAEPSAASDSSRPKNRKRKGANASTSAKNRTSKKRKVE